MDIKDIKAVYFVGAGGIGMSAIARYFIRKGMVVAGYDKHLQLSHTNLKAKECLYIMKRMLMKFHMPVVTSRSA